MCLGKGERMKKHDRLDNWWRPPSDMKVPEKKSARVRAIEYLRHQDIKVFYQTGHVEIANLLANTLGQKFRGSKRDAKNYIRQFLTKKSRSVTKPNKAEILSRKTDFLNSWEWTTLRYQALQKFGRRCMCCGATPETGAVLHVDHIKPRSKFPRLALDINNLQVLCAACNKGKGNWDETDYREPETTLTPEQEQHLRGVLQ